MPIPKDPIKEAEWRRKQSESHQWQKGEKHNCFGKEKPIATRKKIGSSLVKLYQNKENHPRWMGGISLLPYCEKFNEPFKERVRAFFEYHCVKCGTPQRGEKLHVHHVKFNKTACCDGTPRLFVALCRACHTKTNHDRGYWEQYFSELISIQYGGKCYFTEDEMLNGGIKCR